MKLTIQREALNEMVEAASSYESEDPKLGRRFDSAMEAAFEMILQGPTRWPIHIKDARKYRLKKFPYAILYTVEADTVNIVAVMHQKRRPDYWLDRL